MNVETKPVRVRPTLMVIALVGAIGAGWWWWREVSAPPAPTRTNLRRPTPPPITAQPRETPPVAPAVKVPPPQSTPRTPSAQQLEVPIQDQATIDFSYGAPMVKSGGADAEALERSLREINAALKDVSVGPDGKKSSAPATPTPAR